MSILELRREERAEQTYVRKTVARAGKPIGASKVASKRRARDELTGLWEKADGVDAMDREETADIDGGGALVGHLEFVVGDEGGRICILKLVDFLVGVLVGA